MQLVEKNKSGEYELVAGTKKDLEKDFNGLRYLKCDGIDTIGKAKNIYTEKYSDSTKLRVFIPDVITNESTTITLTLCFIGDGHEDVFEDFCFYIRNGVHRYWDTARQRYFDFYIDEEIKVSEEQRKGGTPYLKCDFKLKNIYGETYKVNF